jgi:hypothetical protein
MAGPGGFSFCGARAEVCFFNHPHNGDAFLFWVDGNGFYFFAGDPFCLLVLQGS